MSVVKIDGPRLAPLDGAARQLVVLLHGYGADGNDLIGLGKHWQSLLPQAAFVAPNAPERCAAGGTGYQWFPLSRIDPHEAARGTETVAPVLEAFLDAELRRHGLTAAALALVGFSQGTMMALEVGLKCDPPPLAIVGYSGIVAAPERLPICPGGAPPIYLQHGDADQVIGAPALLLSAAALGAAGLTVRWRLVAGLGHGIDEDGLALGGRFLADAIGGNLAPPAIPVSCRYPRGGTPPA